MTRLIGCFVFFLILIISSFCKRNKQTASIYPSYIALTSTGYKTIDEIPTAEGYERATVERGSFGEWLRRVKLKEDSRIYLLQSVHGIKLALIQKLLHHNGFFTEIS
jgi:hypothetical protein